MKLPRALLILVLALFAAGGLAEGQVRTGPTFRTGNRGARRPVPRRSRPW